MKILSLILLVIGIIVGSWLLTAWWLMLGIGIAHRDWWPAMPSMSYHVALILALFFGGLVGASSAAYRSNSK